MSRTDSSKLMDDVGPSRAARRGNDPTYHEISSDSASARSQNSSVEPLVSVSSASDYIPPTERRLGPEDAPLIQPAKSLDCSGPMELALQKCAAFIIMSSKQSPSFSGDFIQNLADLAAQNFARLATSLHKYTETQRHLQPGYADLELCFQLGNLHLGDLYGEYLSTQQRSQRHRAELDATHEKISTLTREFYSDNYILDPSDPSLIFHANEQYEIANLVPQEVRKKSYIPSYLPDLPPDYTYKATGSYLKTLTDLKQIKLKLVEELRLNERSLYALIEDEGSNKIKEFENDLAALDSDPESEQEDIMSSAGDKNGPEPETPAEAPIVVDDEEQDETAKKDPKFDFVEYARKRTAAKKRELEIIKRRREKRQNNIFMKAETVFSPYAERPPTEEDKEFFKSIVEQGFKKVVKATRIAEQNKKETLKKMIAEKASRELSNPEGVASIEFGFSFNPASNLLDESDLDDAELENLDFGDHPPKSLSAPETVVTPKNGDINGHDLSDDDLEDMLGEGELDFLSHGDFADLPQLALE